MAAANPRDAAVVEAITTAVVGLLYAVHQGDRMAVIGHTHTLLATIIEHNATLGERPSDPALHRALSQLRG